MAHTQLPDLNGITRAADAIRPYLAPTPLLRSELLSRALEADIRIRRVRSLIYDQVFL